MFDFNYKDLKEWLERSKACGKIYYRVIKHLIYGIYSYDIETASDLNIFLNSTKQYEKTYEPHKIEGNILQLTKKIIFDIKKEEIKDECTL